MRRTEKHVESLDHIRGIAILSVLLFHTLGSVYGIDVLPWQGWFRDFSVPTSFLYFLPISIGLMGVPIFFVVSGFCIHLSFQQQGKSWGGFFIRRIFRIYPAYLAALFCFAWFYSDHFALTFTSWELWHQLLAHIFLVHNFQTATIGAVNGSFWSMAVEAQLYLLYPVLLFLVTRAGWRRSLIVLAIIELLIRTVAGVMETLDATETIGGQVSWLLTISPLGYWFSWALGAALADAFLKNEPLPFSKSPLILWAALAVVCYFVKPLFGFRFVLFAVMTAVVASRLLARAEVPQKTSSRWLTALKYFGLWSYSLYLLHQPLLNFYSYVINWLSPGISQAAPLAFIYLVCAWAIIIPLSIFWYQLFELPGIALGKRIILKLNSRASGNNLPKQNQVILPMVAANGLFWMRLGAALLIMIGSLEIAAHLVPRDPEINNNQAWTLATSANAADRNGVRAVALAEDACQRTQYQKTIFVGTLAAAYAEAGRFEEAIVTAQNACALAAAAKDQGLLQKNQELLARYLQRQPYHELAAPAPR